MKKPVFVAGKYKDPTEEKGGTQVGTTWVVTVSPSKEIEGYDKIYDPASAPASGEIIVDATAKVGITIPEQDQRRLVRQFDLLREYPTTTEWSLGVTLPNGFFLGFRQKREFAKVTEKEEIKEKR